MQDIIATRPFTYAGKKYNRGDTISVKPRDAKILMAIGKAAQPVAAQSAQVSRHKTEAAGSNTNCHTVITYRKTRSNGRKLGQNRTKAD